MPRMTNIELLDRPEQPTLFIRTRTPVQALPQLIGGSYGQLAAYLQHLGATLADVPYVAYHNMDMQDLDVEMGFPMARPWPGAGEIVSGSIPAGKAAFCIYRGPYNQMEPVYAEMAAWIAGHGFEPSWASYEQYYNDTPAFPEDDLLTMIVMPVK